MIVNWMPVEKALEMMNKSLSACNDYSNKFMVYRDKTILEIAAGELMKSKRDIF